MNFIRKIISYIKALFLSGLFTILPIILTTSVLIFTYSFIANWLAPLRKMAPSYLQKIPGTEFAIVTIFIMAIGFLLKLFFITPIVQWFEGLINRIPLIRSIYSSSKTLVEFFNVKDPSDKRKKVVLVEFPRKGVFNVGFLLEPATDNFQKLIPDDRIDTTKKYYKIFMPNSPSPATGYFLIMSEDEIIQTDLTFDEAIKSIVSCGLITPKKLNGNDNK